MEKLFALVCLFVAVVIVVLFIVQQAYAWVVPDLFPGAVEQGLIAAEISLWTAFKLEILLALLFGSSRGNKQEENKMKKLVLLVVVLAVLLVSCGDVDALPAPDSDSSQTFKSGSKIPVDDNVYLITGKVTADINGITRQESAGSLSGTTYNGYGSMSGSFWSETTGKGFVRLFVHSASPSTDLAPSEQLVILKTTDSKVTALYPGDVVTLKCRRQYEALAAVRDNESFDAEKLGTWELDYCWLVSWYTA